MLAYCSHVAQKHPHDARLYLFAPSLRVYATAAYVGSAFSD